MDIDSHYDAPMLLIDFDLARVIEGKKEQSDQLQTVVRSRYLHLWAWLMAHQGTPVFMARVAVVGRPLAGARGFGLCGLPLISDEARQFQVGTS